MEERSDKKPPSKVELEWDLAKTNNKIKKEFAPADADFDYRVLTWVYRKLMLDRVISFTDIANDIGGITKQAVEGWFKRGFPSEYQVMLVDKAITDISERKGRTPEYDEKWAKEWQDMLLENRYGVLMGSVRER